MTRSPLCLLLWLALSACDSADRTSSGADASAPDADASAPGADASAPDADASAPDADASAPDADASAPDADAALPAPDGYLTELDDPAALAALSAEGGDVKYLLPTPVPREPPLLADCYFQDMHRFSWHLLFLRSFPELAALDTATYEAWVLQASSRRLYGGSVKLWPAVHHPLTDRQGVLTFTVYANPVSGGLDVLGIAEVAQRLKTCAPFSAPLLVYVPEDAAQQSLARREAAALREAGVAVVFPQELHSGVPSEVYSAGEGYGFLRLLPPGQSTDDLSRQDIAVLETVPNELTLVAGLISAAPQNVHSHINLRLQEKGIPNARVEGIFENALVQALDGTLVHLIAQANGQVLLNPARLEDAQAFWESRRPTLPPIQSDLSVTEPRDFSALRRADALAFGVKAANLGELHRALPPEHRVEGFGLPFSAYARHLADSGLDGVIEVLLADPRMQTERAFRRQALASLRRQIKQAPLSPATAQALEHALRERLGEDALTTRIRLRSSTNVEDLDELTGAGLYDSRSGCLGDDLDGDQRGPSRCLSPTLAQALAADKAALEAELAAYPDRTWLSEQIDDLDEELTEEKPLFDALRKVYASLWNDRAFDERAFYGIDHRQALMGIAAHPAFVQEQASAVVVTNLDGGIYRVVSQVGDGGVVRPTNPWAVAEVITFKRTEDQPDAITLVTPSSLLPEGERVFPNEAFSALVQALFSVQDHFEAEVYPSIRPLRLDLEVELTEDGQVVLKQARPYVTFDPT